MSNPYSKTYMLGGLSKTEASDHLNVGPEHRDRRDGYLLTQKRQEMKDLLDEGISGIRPPQPPHQYTNQQQWAHQKKTRLYTRPVRATIKLRKTFPSRWNRSRPSNLWYAIMRQGRESTLRAGFWQDCYREGTETVPPAGRKANGGPLSEVSHMQSGPNPARKDDPRPGGIIG